MNMNKTIIVSAIATGLLLSGGQIQAKQMTTVGGANNVDLTVYESGNPEGQAIVFIHGFTGNYLVWDSQYSGALAEDFRLIAVDLRGHGASDKPLDPDQYIAAEIWAEDIDAVIRAKELDAPVLVGLSMAGSLIVNYLDLHGEDDIGGLVFVSAPTSQETSDGESVFFDEVFSYVGDMTSQDPRVNITATRGFVHLWTADDLEHEPFTTAFGSAMMVPPAVRGALLQRERRDAEDAFANLEAPALVVHGTADQIVKPEASEDTAEIIPNAELHFYEGIGHLPQLEAPEEFNQDLEAFVRESVTEASQ
ncbi:alpha/beta hydrolase [Aquisalimonas sp.]|uniref:alpha/beta fold hydrolase n=1 Tax=Aquisalimonas sp. TaxID=1872621 RepID=UPI0025BAC2F1|nr:alpha/beta hydrolase [Aquisalimonas sp.]